MQAELFSHGIITLNSILVIVCAREEKACQRLTYCHAVQVLAAAAEQSAGSRSSLQASTRL